MAKFVNDHSNKYKPCGGPRFIREIELVGPRKGHRTPRPEVERDGKAYLEFRSRLCDCCHRVGIAPSREPHRCGDCRRCTRCWQCTESAEPRNGCPHHVSLASQEKAFVRARVDEGASGPKRIAGHRGKRRRTGSRP
jgi:hypothetical protein